MEFLKNLINPISERVRSPFYGAFFISWILVNWRIILAIFSNSEVIEGLSQYQFISNQLNDLNYSVYLPLLFTAIYLLALPWIDYFIYWYSEFVKKQKTKRKLLIGKRQQVSGETFYNLWERMQEQKGELGKALSEIDRIQNRAIEFEEKADGQELLIKAYSDRNDPRRLFQGNWVCRFKEKDNENFKDDFFSLNQTGQYCSISDNNKVIGVFDIDYFDTDPYWSTVKFLKIDKNESSNNDNMVKITRVKLTNNSNTRGNVTRLEGKEIAWDGKVFQVVYEKV